MNRAERRRLERQGQVRNDKPCPFPGCTGLVPVNSVIKACIKHEQLIKDVLFILDHTRRPGEVASPAERRAVQQKPSNIILPGSKAFQDMVKRV